MARFIFLERLRLSNNERIAAEGFYPNKITLKTEVEDDEFEPLRDCFEKLDEEEKNILRKYFADVPYSKLIENREEICVENNITANHLRLKVFRLRQSLYNCVKKKLNRIK